MVVYEDSILWMWILIVVILVGGAITYYLIFYFKMKWVGE
jgi:hypothetical protein